MTPDDLQKTHTKKTHVKTVRAAIIKLWGFRIFIFVGRERQEETFSKPWDTGELPRFYQVTASISSRQIVKEQCGSVSMGVKQRGETLSLLITNNKMEVVVKWTRCGLSPRQRHCTISTFRGALLAAGIR